MERGGSNYSRERSKIFLPKFRSIQFFFPWKVILWQHHFSGSWQWIQVVHFLLRPGTGHEKKSTAHRGIQPFLSRCYLLWFWRHRLAAGHYENLRAFSD